MKPRNYVAKDMYTNGLYRAKVVECKKAYKRKSKHKETYDYDTRKSTHARDKDHYAQSAA
mgnify:CR=1 FL=1